MHHGLPIMHALLMRALQRANCNYISMIAMLDQSAPLALRLVVSVSQHGPRQRVPEAYRGL